MEINKHHLCIGCMHELQNKEICPYCGLEQRSYTPIPRCLIMGTRLAERYVLGRVLGEGSFGITYIGWDTLLEIPVAIKEYYPSDLVSRDVIRGNDNSVYLFGGIEKEEYDRRLERFLKEARNLTRFNQLSSIVSVRDFFYANNTAYIVMDYIEGESLKAYIKRKGTMDAGEVLKIFRPILESLEKMHATGIIHRDISPDNLLFDENHNLVLIDFGAAELQNAELTRTVTITFKRGFSPEEQYRSHGKQGPWTDIYALCASMYYAMTGIAPDEAIQRTIEDKVTPLRNEPGVMLTNAQAQAIMKGMSVHGEDRFQSVAALYQQLYGEGATGETPKKGRQADRMVAWILGIAFVLIGIVGGSVGYRRMTRLHAVRNATEDIVVTQNEKENSSGLQGRITENAKETPEERVTMVSCVGHTKSEIQQILTTVKNITFRVEWQEEYSNEIPSGQVMEQSIPEGEELEEGEEYDLRLIISAGPEPVQTTETVTTQQTTKSAPAKNNKSSSTKKPDELDGYIE